MNEERCALVFLGRVRPSRREYTPHGLKARATAAAEFSSQFGLSRYNLVVLRPLTTVSSALSLGLFLISLRYWIISYRTGASHYFSLDDSTHFRWSDLTFNTGRGCFNFVYTNHAFQTQRDWRTFGQNHWNMLGLGYPPLTLFHSVKAAPATNFVQSDFSFRQFTTYTWPTSVEWQTSTHVSCPAWFAAVATSGLPLLWLTAALRSPRRFNLARESCGFDLLASPKRCSESHTTERSALPLKTLESLSAYSAPPAEPDEQRECPFIPQVE